MVNAGKCNNTISQERLTGVTFYCQLSGMFAGLWTWMTLWLLFLKPMLSSSRFRCFAHDGIRGKSQRYVCPLLFMLAIKVHVQPELYLMVSIECGFYFFYKFQSHLNITANFICILYLQILKCIHGQGFFFGTG